MGRLNECPQPQQEPQGSEVVRQGVLEAWLRLPEAASGGVRGWPREEWSLAAEGTPVSPMLEVQGGRWLAQGHTPLV